MNTRACPELAEGDTGSETATGESAGLQPGISTWDFNADEAFWGWARNEAIGSLCPENVGAVQEQVDRSLNGLASREDEVRQRCRTVLQSKAEAILLDILPDSPLPANAHPTLALV